jgi:acetyl esterase/lipase
VEIVLKCWWWVFAVCVVVACGGVSAQQAVWQPSAGHAQVPIWRDPWAHSPPPHARAPGPAYHDDCQCNIHPKAPTALEDAQRTVGLVRFHAMEWHIGPRKIGVLGFSAGGYLVANISTHYAQRSYAPVDAADKVSCRPDFAVAIYPGHMLENTTKEFELNPEIPFTAGTPPTFLLQNEDDNVDGVKQSLVYYIALKNAGVPVEMHLYAQGGHAFGLRPTKIPVTRLPELVEAWLETIGMIGE